MKKILRSYAGFTLVELLVVVAIIAILSVIGLTLFSGAQKNARDARRKADVDAVASALEIKRLPGVTYYEAIVNTDMSSGLIPEDSVNQSAKYCILLYATDDGAKTQPDPAITSWPTSSPCATSPAGFRQAIVSDGFLATNFPVNTYKSFKVCARLEGSGGSVFCKNSTQ